MSYSKTGQRYPDDDGGSSIGILFEPMAWIVLAITVLFLFVIMRVIEKRPAQDHPWREIARTAVPVAVLTHILTLITTGIFAIPLDRYIPTYCIVFWAAYLFGRWDDMRHNKANKKQPPAPPDKKLPIHKDHDKIQYAVKR